jgi:hypothetical protein
MLWTTVKRYAKNICSLKKHKIVFGDFEECDIYPANWQIGQLNWSDGIGLEQEKILLVGFVLMEEILWVVSDNICFL